MVGGNKWRQHIAGSHEKCAWVPCIVRIRLWTVAEKEMGA
jgi:hypothetical protein